VSASGAERHLARERALEILYEREMKGRQLDQVLASLSIAPDPYTIDLLGRVDEHRAEVEASIERHATGWTLDRMAVVDRLIMTLALSELRSPDAPPVAVVLDEAVEFARTFSTDESPKFVNGVLAACVAEDV
jgi:N utilization substance protein B